MAKYVHEIVNPELFSVPPTESVSNALLGLLAMRITAAPVLSEEGHPIGVISLRDLLGEEEAGTVRERMTKPVHVVGQGAEIVEAGRLMADRDVHHLVCVDDEGRATGVISSLDVVRALLGIPIRYPDSFPHIDSEGLTWTDPTILDLERAAVAPDGPGLLVLFHSEAGRPDLPVWAETANNLHARIHELLQVPQTETPYLARLLEHSLRHLRFRAAPVADPRARALGLQHAQERVTRASGLPVPSKGSRE